MPRTIIRTDKISQMLFKHQAISSLGISGIKVESSYIQIQILYCCVTRTENPPFSSEIKVDGNLEMCTSYSER